MHLTGPQRKVIIGLAGAGRRVANPPKAATCSWRVGTGRGQQRGQRRRRRVYPGVIGPIRLSMLVVGECKGVAGWLHGYCQCVSSPHWRQSVFVLNKLFCSVLFCTGFCISVFCSGENIGEGEDLMVVPFPKNDHRFRTTMGEEAVEGLSPP